MLKKNIFLCYNVHIVNTLNIILQYSYLIFKKEFNMSNLIITLIGIALVAVISIIALFFLGDTFKDSAGKADYGRLQNEANQIVIATELYMAENSGRPPSSVDELYQNSEYLKNKFGTLTNYIEVNGEPVEVEWKFGFTDYVTQITVRAIGIIKSNTKRLSGTLSI